MFRPLWLVYNRKEAHIVMENASGMTELTLEEIAELDVTTTVGKRKSSKTINLDSRNMETWFKLPTSLGFCENPNCPDDRPRKVQEGNAMVATVKEKHMCRICFLNGWLK